MLLIEILLGSSWNIWDSIFKTELFLISFYIENRYNGLIKKKYIRFCFVYRSGPWQSSIFIVALYCRLNFVFFFFVYGFSRCILIWVQESEAQKTNGSVCFQICGIIWFRFDIWWTSDVSIECSIEHGVHNSYLVLFFIFISWIGVRSGSYSRMRSTILWLKIRAQELYIFFFNFFINRMACRWFVVDIKWTTFFFFRFDIH